MDNVLCERCEERRLPIAPSVCSLHICSWCFLHRDRDMTRESHFGELKWKSGNHDYDREATNPVFKEI